MDGNYRHHRSIAETENNRTRDISMEGETGTSSSIQTVKAVKYTEPWCNIIVGKIRKTGLIFKPVKTRNKRVGGVKILDVDEESIMTEMPADVAECLNALYSYIDKKLEVLNLAAKLNIFTRDLRNDKKATAMDVIDRILACYRKKYPDIDGGNDGIYSRDISMEGETGTSSNTISNSSNNDVEMYDAVVFDEFSVMEVEAGIGEDAHIGEAAVMEVEATTMSNAINDENVNDFSLDERYTPESLEALMKCKAIITPDSDEELTIFTRQKKQDLEVQGIEFDKDLLAQYKEVRCESRLKLEAFFFFRM